MIFNFFFQAEDGIRDRDVTGVQTCALPIFIESPTPFGEDSIMTRFVAAMVVGALGAFVPDCAVAQAKRYPLESVDNRSEERRVGKECSCRYWSDERKESELADRIVLRLRHV